jgi:hypothetical protein
MIGFCFSFYCSADQRSHAMMAATRTRHGRNGLIFSRAERPYVARSLTDMWSKIPTGSRATVIIKSVLRMSGSKFPTMPLKRQAICSQQPAIFRRLNRRSCCGPSAEQTLRKRLIARTMGARHLRLAERLGSPMSDPLAGKIALWKILNCASAGASLFPAMISETSEPFRLLAQSADWLGRRLRRVLEGDRTKSEGERARPHGDSCAGAASANFGPMLVISQSKRRISASGGYC